MVKILCLGGSEDPWHQFSEYQTSLERILKSLPVTVHYTEDLDSLLPQNLQDFDHIICCVSKKHLTSEQEQGLLSAISGSNPKILGKAKHFFGLHCATTAFQDSFSYSSMIGARFLAHPPRGNPLLIQMLEPNHPICKDIGDFQTVDELYLMEFYGNHKFLFQTKYDEFSCPLGWVKTYGLGKVGYCALGHGEEQLANPHTSQIVQRFVHWLIQEI
jgi:type 1 glutamine amidotransferase